MEVEVDEGVRFLESLLHSWHQYWAQRMAAELSRAQAPPLGAAHRAALTAQLFSVAASAPTLLRLALCSAHSEALGAAADAAAPALTPRSGEPEAPLSAAAAAANAPRQAAYAAAKAACELALSTAPHLDRVELDALAAQLAAQMARVDQRMDAYLPAFAAGTPSAADPLVGDFLRFVVWARRADLDYPRRFAVAAVPAIASGRTAFAVRGPPLLDRRAGSIDGGSMSPPLAPGGSAAAASAAAAAGARPTGPVNSNSSTKVVSRSILEKLRGFDRHLVSVMRAYENVERAHERKSRRVSFFGSADKADIQDAMREEERAMAALSLHELQASAALPVAPDSARGPMSLSSSAIPTTSCAPTDVDLDNLEQFVLALGGG